MLAGARGVSLCSARDTGVISVFSNNGEKIYIRDPVIILKEV